MLFARGHRLRANITQEDDVYQIQGHREHPKGYWEEDQSQKVQFPRRATHQHVIDRMLAILQETAGAAQN
jgi:hypothetical protein